MSTWAEEHLPVPTTLEDAIRERNAWVESAMQFSRNEDFYRGIVVRIGNMFGVAARISDDGSVQDDVLALRIPDLVRALIDREQKPTVSLDVRDIVNGTAAIAARLRSQ